MKYEIHPFAKLIPMACDDDWDKLKDDIASNGIRVPVVIFENMILDGRSRYVIANSLNKRIPIEHFSGTSQEALSMVASYNLFRRHLTPSQKAMAACRIAGIVKERDGLSSIAARELAQTLTGASKGYIEKAIRIDDGDQSVGDAILSGKQTIGGHLGRSTTKCPRCGHEW